ncbi:hypothetical protein LTR27_009881 [Elasticomyces elasticus]|nr:hypothetical protein LTR27_009881 [Elasticomyces elasticus]
MVEKMFAEPRRIVTGHSSSGAAIVVADSLIRTEPILAQARHAVLYETHAFPASNDEWNDPISIGTKDLANGDGIVLRVVDFPPETVTVRVCTSRIAETRADSPLDVQMFHRTVSLDFAILHKGRISCILDDNVQIDMAEGDVCVQRGTVHGWTNGSAEPARVFFVLSAANPVTAGGQTLQATGYEKRDVESGGN